MKAIEFSERELETLIGILNLEESDLKVIQSKLKKSGQDQDLVDVNVELVTVTEILRKLRGAYYG